MTRYSNRTRMRRRQQRFSGLIPSLARWFWAQIVAVWRHPQPVIVGVLVCGIVWALTDFTQRADAFRIASVQLPPESGLQLKRELVGENIWSLDLQWLAGDLKSQQPWLKEVRVVRQLPNRLVIETLVREPAAQVRGDRWYPVDADGVILPQPSAEMLANLPRIAGIAPVKSAGKTGRVSEDPALHLALRVLRTIREYGALSGHRLEAVDVTNPAGIRLIFDGETEIRCGSEPELPAHLDRLKTAFAVVAQQRMAVKYIDVRFEDPVVAPRT